MVVVAMGEGEIYEGMYGHTRKLEMGYMRHARVSSTIGWIRIHDNFNNLSRLLIS
jgi:hypothetical protein